MPLPAISVQSVSKSFVDRYRVQSARKALESLVRAPFASPAVPRDSQLFWALRDIDFQIAPGEVVGIVGRNGAGKSVLLKILSRVTRPTLGRVEIRGRVAPLLEVGTGFHPELSGRENIFLNGVILGMRRSEVQRRVDQIVAFAETEDVLEVPIKWYSTGMRMRLAFSVAAHLDRDIFLLDEVFAVGDREFRERCQQRLRELARQGRTILLVNHAANAIQQICSRALLLEGGRLIADGSPAEISARYEQMRRQTADLAARQAANQ